MNKMFAAFLVACLVGSAKEITLANRTNAGLYATFADSSDVVYMRLQVPPYDTIMTPLDDRVTRAAFYSELVVSGVNTSTPYSGNPVSLSFTYPGASAALRFSDVNTLAVSLSYHEVPASQTVELTNPDAEEFQTHVVAVMIVMLILITLIYAKQQSK